LDNPGVHHGRLNVAAQVKNVADAIITTAKTTGTRKLMYRTPAARVGPDLFKVADVL
jgi:hypothetical protein